MAQRHISARLLAVAVIVSLAGPVLPAAAEPASAALSGVIRSAADQSPLADVRLLVVDRESAEVTRSEWTVADGNFSIAELDPGRYDLAVEVQGGLYLIRAPLDLMPGVQRAVQIAVGIVEPEDDKTDNENTRAPLPSAWDNPVAAGAIVLGLAILIGVLVKNATGDEITSTNTNTTVNTAN
jgi:hypothetical protein